MQSKILLAIGAVLIAISVFRPSISNFVPHQNSCVVANYVMDAPSDDVLLEKARDIIAILQKSSDSTTSKDCLKLSSLYADMSLLIELDDTDRVIKDTASIREANALAGPMLRLNIKDKYPNLAETSRALVISAIGDDDVVLDETLRAKASEAFRALSWAFYEGSK